MLRSEWPELLAELVVEGVVDATRIAEHRGLSLVGLVGSIDNDMFGTDMTIGADTALHRITEAVDALQSTASSHQRTFVIEVMGRNCGYLALMGSLATGANFVMIPERPSARDWEDRMYRVLRAGREIGRRANIVVVAEGARDDGGVPVTAHHVKAVLEERLGEDTRVTILGHVQRGGSPSAFDRYLGTVLGYAAVRQLLDSPDAEPQLIGLRGHRLTTSPLIECVAATRPLAALIADGKYDEAIAMRGGSFTDSFQLLQTIVQADPQPPQPAQRALRLAVLHASEPERRRARRGARRPWIAATSYWRSPAASTDAPTGPSRSWSGAASAAGWRAQEPSSAPASSSLDRTTWDASPPN